jgi:HAD superfamily hydrolase (TIGR01509 family)
MAIEAVLFDFSNTLFRLEESESWFVGLVDHSGQSLDDAARAELMRRVTAPVGQVVSLDAEHQHAWDHRDLDSALHRKAYLEILRQSGVHRPDQATALYELMINPLEWTPYPDTEAALKAVAERGLKVGVLSNIGYDIRPAFTVHGWDAYVNTFVLSFEVGAVKPDPGIFHEALRALEVPAAQTLMVGDSEEADGAARELGCQFALVAPLPTTERPDALLATLEAHDLV